jgi:hypothetical protein
MLYRKPLGDNIYKQWELGLMIIRLDIEIWVIGNGDSKKGG